MYTYTGPCHSPMEPPALPQRHSAPGAARRGGKTRHRSTIIYAYKRNRCPHQLSFKTNERTHQGVAGAEPCRWSPFGIRLSKGRPPHGTKEAMVVDSCHRSICIYLTEHGTNTNRAMGPGRLAGRALRSAGTNIGPASIHPDATTRIPSQPNISTGRGQPAGGPGVARQARGHGAGLMRGERGEEPRCVR